MSRFTAQANERGRTIQYGPVVNRELLLEFIRPAIKQHGLAEFSRRAGVDARQIHRILSGNDHNHRTRLRVADRLLTKGLGRPDLVQLVCPEGDN